MKSSRRGFTLMETMVSFSILILSFTIILPQWNKMRSVQMCNNAAQEMASDIKRLMAESIHAEAYTCIVTTANGYTTYRIPQTYSTVTSNWTIMRTKNFTVDYGRVN